MNFGVAVRDRGPLVALPSRPSTMLAVGTGRHPSNGRLVAATASVDAVPSTARPADFGVKKRMLTKFGAKEV